MNIRNSWPSQWKMSALALSLGLSLLAPGAAHAQEVESGDLPAPTPVQVGLPALAQAAAQSPAQTEATKSPEAKPQEAKPQETKSQDEAQPQETKSQGEATKSEETEAQPTKSQETKAQTDSQVKKESQEGELTIPHSAAPKATEYAPEQAPNPSQAASAPAEAPAGPILPAEVGDVEGAPLYTLRQAMQVAMRHSPELNSARAAYEQAKGATEEAYTGGNPTLSLGATYTYTEPEIAMEMEGEKIVVGFKHNYDAALTLNQVISTFGRLHYSVLAAQMAEYAALESYRQVLESQLASTATKFLEVLLAQEAVVIADQQLEAQRSSLKQAEDMYAGGTAAKFDVLRVRSAATAAELTLIEAKNALRLAKASLCSQMGLPQGTEFNLAPFNWENIPDNIVTTYNLEESIAAALERRPDVKSAQWAKEAARARLELSRTSANPTLSLQSTVTNSRATAMAPDTMWNTSIVFSMPLFDGGVEAAQSAQLEAAVKQMEANLESVNRGVRLDVEQCYYNLNSRWERIVQARVGLEQAEEAYRVAEVRYAAGLSTPTELLDSQSALVEAKRSLATAKYSYLGANVNWVLATSGAYPFPVDGPLDISDLKTDLEAWYLSDEAPSSEAQELIDPIGDKDIPAPAAKPSPADVEMVDNLSQQIKAQTLKPSAAPQAATEPSAASSVETKEEE